MSVQKSYKNGTEIKELTKNWGVRRTFNSLKKVLKSSIRIKHNKIQVLNKRRAWTYVT